MRSSHNWGVRVFLTGIMGCLGLWVEGLENGSIVYRSIRPHLAFPLAASVVVIYRVQEEARQAKQIVTITRALIFIVLGGWVLKNHNAARSQINIPEYIKKCKSNGGPGSPDDILWMLLSRIL